MYNWNLIVIGLFLVTYAPIFWFLGMSVASGQIVKCSRFHEVDPKIFIPAWALSVTKICFILHYCLFLIPLTMLDWLHGLAAFGAGILLFLLCPLLNIIYLQIFKRHALRAFRTDPGKGRLMIKVLKAGSHGGIKNIPDDDASLT